VAARVVVAVVKAAVAVVVDTQLLNLLYTMVQAKARLENRPSLEVLSESRIPIQAAVHQKYHQQSQSTTHQNQNNLPSPRLLKRTDLNQAQVPLITAVITVALNRVDGVMNNLSTAALSMVVNNTAALSMVVVNITVVLSTVVANNITAVLNKVDGSNLNMVAGNSLNMVAGTVNNLNMVAGTVNNLNMVVIKKVLSLTVVNTMSASMKV